jgi:hypothetical protein
MTISGKQEMTTMRWWLPNGIGGLAALLMLPASGAFSGPAASAELPVPVRQAAPPVQPARPMSRTCIGADGKPFRWDQPNVPFAAICSFDADGPTTPRPPALK